MYKLAVILIAGLLVGWLVARIRRRNSVELGQLMSQLEAELREEEKVRVFEDNLKRSVVQSQKEAQRQIEKDLWER
jgi:hypothetical protein